MAPRKLAFPQCGPPPSSYLNLLLRPYSPVQHRMALLIIVLALGVQVTHSSISNNQFQVIRKLTTFRSYKDAQLFRFQIPPETTTATLRLNASQSEIPVNASISFSATSPPTIEPPPTTTTPIPYWIPTTSAPPTTTSSLFNTTLITVYKDKAIKFYRSFLTTACKKPLDVVFYLRWGSLPLLSIKNASAPEDFVFNDTAEQYRVDLKTDGHIVLFNLTNPLPGDWYGLAFVNQTNDKIVQKGLERECFYRMVSSVTFERLAPSKQPVPILAPFASAPPLKQSLVVDQHDSKPELLYKFFPSTKELGAKLVIKNCQFRASSNLRHHPIQPSQPQSPYSPNNYGTNNNVNNGFSEQTQPGSIAHNSSQWVNSSCPLLVNFNTLSLPSSSKRDFAFSCQTSNHSGSGVSIEAHTGKCIIDLPTYAPNEWNYLQIVPSFNNEPAPADNWARTKLTYGSINFTIQLLLGQEAFLYNYFNDQCASAQSPTGGPMFLSSTHNPLSGGYQNNFGIINKNEAKVYNSFLTTAASSAVAPQPEPNPVSHSKVDQSEVVVAASASNRVNSGMEVDEFDVNPHSSIVKPTTTTTANGIRPTGSNVSTGTVRPAKTTHPHARNEDSIDYVEEDEEEAADEDVERELAKSSLAQFAKRSADPQPPPAGGKDRKKGADRKKEERKGKKPKDKQNRKKAKAEAHKEDECQFDPTKVLNSLDEEDLANMTLVTMVNMTRYQSGDIFEFKYSHLDATNLVDNQNLSQVPTFEVDNDRPSLVNFTIMPQFDIGGSFVIDFAISAHTPNQFQNVSAILCLTHNRLPPIVASSPGIRFDEFCYGHLVSNTSVANYSTAGSPVRTLVVPYPQPGTWFISVVVRCYTEEDTLEDPLVANVDYSGYSCEFSNKTSILLDIRSSSCHNSKCLNGGKCLQYLNGGILYSTCSCRAGWKGWICNDGSEALSEQKLLMNFLLLTVSNAAFIPAILVAACRRYFTESVIYLITMASATLYHACDSDYSQSYCVLSVGLLQFADFYTAVLSFFVTLITLANLSARCKSFLHLMGAIAIALITQNDRLSLWTFVIPAGLATVLLFTCWCSQCCRRSCYPPTKCWIFSVCPALILTVVGLILYAFFETHDNYAITHSIWHGIVALALLFAIPSMPSTASAENEEEDDERVHFMSSSSSSGAGSGKGTANKSHPETYYELIGEEASHLARSHPQGVPPSAKHMTKTY